MLYLVSSNGYTTSSIYVQTLDQATETYVALRGLPAFKDAVWTLKSEQHWLHDHANGVGKPDWWYEVAPDLYAPYRHGRASGGIASDLRRPAERRSSRRTKTAAPQPTFSRPSTCPAEALA